MNPFEGAAPVRLCDTCGRPEGLKTHLIDILSPTTNEYFHLCEDCSAEEFPDDEQCDTEN